jgi:GNAT superfamily N-acetyltransferase
VEGHRIEEWNTTDPRWGKLTRLLEREEQLSWVLPDGELRPDSHVLVAVDRQEPVGFLAFVRQEIGPPDGCPPIGLTEAKVLAFGVTASHRRRGIGTALQLGALELAAALGCYQMRSVSDAVRDENRRVKLGLGFGVTPTIRRLRDGEKPAFVFVKAFDQAARNSASGR